MAGVVIATVRAIPVTVIDFVSVPETSVQATVIVFGPATIGTLAGDVAVVPLTVQVIGAVPVAWNATLIGVTAELLPVAGESIVVTMPLTRLTETAAVPAAMPLLQLTVIVLAPMVGSEAVLLPLAPDVEAAPLTVQVVPAGIVVEPSTV